MELSGCQGQSQFTNRKEECVDVKVDSKQAGIPTCSDISFDSVTLVWGQPQLNANAIQYYEVKYKIHTEKKWFSVDTKDKMNNFRIEGLKCNTAYDFRVRAVYDDDDEDEAPLSSICQNIMTKEQTLKDRKEECADIRVDSKQAGIPSCIDISFDSVTLVWGQPQCNSCAVQYYEVKFKIHEEKKWFSINTKDKMNTFRIEGLKSNTAYDFRVRAVYDDEDEAPISSICQNIMTKEQSFNDHKEECVDAKVDSKQAGIPICSDVSSDSVTLTWSKPHRNIEAIQYYEVKYKIHEEKMWHSVYTKDEKNTFRIESLKSKTGYDFRVRAIYNDDGDVDEAPLSSICQNIMTKENVVRSIPKGAQKLTDDKPSIYKLPFIVIQNSVNEDAKTRKCVFGNKPHGQFQEKTVMVVGGTGAGKSTMVNAIVNYVMNVNWEDNIRYSITELMDKEKGNGNDESKSQTEWITCYTIFPQKGSKLDYTFHMIDTPGFGDTRGIEMDRAIVSHLGTFFNSAGERGIDILDAVWFVAKAPDEKLTPSQKYIFDSILSIFGKDMEGNIFVVVTFADNKHPPVMKALKTAKVPFQNHFIFNNSSLFMNNDDDEENQCGPIYWKMSKESFKQMFDELRKTQHRSVQLTADVLTIRRNLETTIQGVQKRIGYGLSKLDTIRQEQRIFEDNAAKVAANEGFSYVVPETRQKMKSLKPGTCVTNCLICNISCHYPCSIPKDEDKSGCAAMRDGKCTVCPKKCDWQSHHNNQYRFKFISVQVTKTNEDMLRKYGLANNEKQMHLTILDKLKEEFDEIRTKVSSLIQEVRECVNRLKEMALKEDPLSPTQYIDVLIECEKKDSKPGFTERMQMLEAMKKEDELLQTLPDKNYDPWSVYMSNSSAE